MELRLDGSRSDAHDGGDGVDRETNEVVQRDGVSLAEAQSCHGALKVNVNDAIVVV